MSHIYLTANTNIQPKRQNKTKFNKKQRTPQNVLNYFTQGGIEVRMFQGSVWKLLHLPCCQSSVGENTWPNLLTVRLMQMQEDHVWAAAQREKLLMSNCSMKSKQNHRREKVTWTVSNVPQSLLSNHTALLYRTLAFPFMISAHIFWSTYVCSYIYFFNHLLHIICAELVKVDSCFSVSLTARKMQENPP